MWVMSGKPMVDESGIRERWLVVREELDERGRRIWAAAEARSHGLGGIAAVVRATAISESTVRHGIEEVLSGDRAPAGRVRRAGAGRKPILVSDPELDDALEGLIDGATRGDPESPLRWTSRSVAKLTDGLRAIGHHVHDSTTRRRLLGLGYSLQANRKTREGADHPDRDAQFGHIAQVTGQALKAKQPVISVDTKKKELIGDYKNGGRELARSGEPIEVNTHDFPDKKLGKAIPYGVYDLASNQGWVSVGIDHDTARFATSSIRRWWQEMGAARFPRATELMITADGGGSNSSRNRLWKVALQDLANDLSLALQVCHFPPGTSKWNKIEHRLFCFITKNWRGRPLTSYEVIVNLISNTTTKTGLIVRAALDTGAYETGIEISDEQLARVHLTRAKFHGEWNYTIRPKR